VPIELVGLDSVAGFKEVDETGNTYLENARMKPAMQASGMPTLAEDSGLEVPALGGLPGVRSARFAGPGASSEVLVRTLLDRLGASAGEAPQAFFRCVAVLLMPDGRAFIGEGVLEGTICPQPRGAGGFGYDPIFTLANGRTLAELTLEEKNTLSHRARALTQLEVRGAFDAVMGVT
jgi:XTP/dITP diphosphohydrolase